MKNRKKKKIKKKSEKKFSLKILKNSLFSRTPVVAAAGIKAFFLVCDAYNFKIYEDSITQT